FVGRQQRRREVSDERLAAHLGRLREISLRRTVVADDPAPDELARSGRADFEGAKPRALVARRLESRRVYRRIQLGAGLHLGVARGALSGRVAGLGAAVGRPAAAELALNATLRRRSAGGDRRRGPVLADVE